MQSLGISQEALATALTCTRGAIGHYLAGRRSPTLFQLETIAARLQVDPCWLLFGREMVRERKSTYRASDEGPCAFPIRGSTADDSDATMPGSVRLGDCSDDIYALLVEGTRWAPRYYEGELILLCPSLEPLPGYELWVSYRDGSKDLLSLVRLEKKRVVFDNLTEPRKRQIRPLSTITSMHCVVGVLRDGAAADPA